MNTYDIPLTYDEAVTSYNWKSVMEEEYQSFIENNTWSLEELPLEKKAIKSNGFLRLRVFKVQSKICSESLFTN